MGPLSPPKNPWDICKKTIFMDPLKIPEIRKKNHFTGPFAPLNTPEIFISVFVKKLHIRCWKNLTGTLDLEIQ